MTTILFWASFGMTLVLLAAALASGLSRRRKVHLVLGPATLLALGVAIYFAIAMGKVRAFPADVMAIHRPVAVVSALAGVAVGGSGLYLLLTGGGRRAHRVAVALFALAAVGATGTGIWAFSASTPLP